MEAKPRSRQVEAHGGGNQAGGGGNQAGGGGRKLDGFGYWFWLGPFP